ncbi:helicase-associated domain-containing protein [Candidatus Amarolinea dominans]|uniref:helicase-associated domain-containing protein n=1 Tax=Candidatus Amarolinea dominans TaxID=3140696 RepID=UPI001D4A1F01|nr:helicase-associated domain-containing protein [Anaerolineae bacterium]
MTSQGAAWLAGQPHRVNAPPPAPIRVEADFNVYVPHSAAAFDRFRVARCTQWEASQPDFRYRITQTALRRAAAAGVTANRVLAFLRYVTQGQLPSNVARALEKLES